MTSTLNTAETHHAPDDPMPLDEVDLADNDKFLDGVTPWRMFHTLRHQDPVHWQPEPAPNHGFWARHPARGHRPRATATRRPSPPPSSSTSKRSTTTRSRCAAPCWRRTACATARCAAAAAQFGHGRHQQVRRLPARPDRQDAGHGAAPRARSTSSPRSPPTSRSTCWPGCSTCPPEDNQQLIDWGNRIIGNTDPDYADVLLDSEESEQYQHLPFRSPASLEVFEYGRELAAQRRGGNGTDLIARLVNQNPARRRAALRTGLRQLLPAAGGRRQRDHPAHHLALHAGADRAPGAAGQARRRTRR